MYHLFCLLALQLTILVQLATASPIDLPKGYQFQYKTPDGTYRQEIGTIGYNPQEPNVPILRVKGQFSYFDITGRKIQRFYEADENGARSKDEILPPQATNNKPVTSPPKIGEVTLLPPLPPYIPHEVTITLPPLPPPVTSVPPPPLSISSAALASLAG